MPGINTDLIIIEVAARIFCPEVSTELPGAGACIAAAYVQVIALGAAAFNRALVQFEPGHQRVGGVHPDIGKRPLFNTADGVIPPHRVRVHIAEVIDV